MQKAYFYDKCGDVFVGIVAGVSDNGRAKVLKCDPGFIVELTDDVAYYLGEIDGFPSSLAMAQVIVERINSELIDYPTELFLKVKEWLDVDRKVSCRIELYYEKEKYHADISGCLKEGSSMDSMDPVGEMTDADPMEIVEKIVRFRKELKEAGIYGGMTFDCMPQREYAPIFTGVQWKMLMTEN